MLLESNLHGWLCPLSKQEEIQKILQEAKINHESQPMSLPKGFISTDPRVTGKQTRLEFLEMQIYKEDLQLFEDIYRFDASMRPEDFYEEPTEEGKGSDRLIIEKDFYYRRIDLQKKKEEAEQLRQELAHLKTDPGEKIFDSHAPLLIADAVIREHFLWQEHRTLQYCSDAFWRWDGIKYIELNEAGMRQIIYDFLRDAKGIVDGGLENFNPNKFKVDQIIDALRALCYQSHHPASGSIWLDNRQEPNPKYIISFQNGLLDMESWLKNSSIPLIPHTPLLLNTNTLTFDFDPNFSAAQEWISFLNGLWPEDPESLELLQEWMGYLLVQETRHHKILLIIGPPRSGKGTIGRILRELLGDFNVIGPTLSSLGGEFGLQPFLNKMLASISDARLNSRGNHSLIIERLLSISGEDPLTINRKFLPAITTQLPTRIMMMSNELPDLRDASGALANRYLVLTLSKSWLGNEDTFLFQRLRQELPGILLWAMQGLARLQMRGRFFQPKSSLHTIEELEAMTSPIKAFATEKCIIHPTKSIAIPTLFDAWRSWCELTGYPHAGNVQSFGKNLRAAFPSIEITRPQEDSSRTRYYKGISLLDLKREFRPRTSVDQPERGFE